MSTNDRRKSLYLAIIAMIPVITAVVAFGIRTGDLAGSVYTGFATLILTGALSVYMLISKKWEKITNTGIVFYAMSVCLSVLFLLLFDMMNHTAVFLPCVVAGAAVLGVDFGIILSVALYLIAGIIGNTTASIAIILLIGALLCILSGWLGKNVRNLLLTCITAGCSAVMIRMIGENYSEELLIGIPELLIQVIIGIVLAHSIVFCWKKYVSESDIYEEKPLSYLEMVALDAEEKDKENLKSIHETLSEILTEESREQLMNKVYGKLGQDVDNMMSQENDKKVDVSFYDERESKENWIEYTDEENPLMKRFYEELPKKYAASKKVAEFCRKAAKCIDADADFAEAIAMYAEIGRIVDKKNYAEAGRVLMEENNIPRRLTEAALQSIDKTAKPGSKETVIVMAAINAISTIKYFKKMKEEYNIDKIVDTTFQVRLMKGNLDDSGLSVREYSQLKNFFQVELHFI